MLNSNLFFVLFMLAVGTGTWIHQFIQLRKEEKYECYS